MLAPWLRARAFLAILALVFGCWADPATTNEGPGVFILKAAPPHGGATGRVAAKIVGASPRERSLPRFEVPGILLVPSAIRVPGVGWLPHQVDPHGGRAYAGARPFAGRAPPAPAC